MAEWSCDNYTEPVTCLSAGASETALCRICRIRAADRLFVALRERVDLASQLRSLAADPHSRAVLSKAFREAPMANAAEALLALADDVEKHGLRWRGSTPADVSTTPASTGGQSHA